MKYEFKKVFKEEKELIESYDAYTQTVFGFDLNAWRGEGLWKDQYVPNTLLSGDKIIANISACIIELQVKGESIKAIQLGAVGVLEEYRGKGLARELMGKVIEEYKQYPLIYLFASDDVSQFYIKCGFRPVKEITPYINVEGSTDYMEPAKITRDAEPIEHLLKTKLQHSAIIDARGNESIYKFHLLYNFNDSIYYIKEKDIVFIADYEEDSMCIYDIMSEKEVAFDEIKRYILKENTKKVKFCFTPDWLKLEYKVEPSLNNSLYVYGEFPADLKECRLPYTSVT